tara:strand:+ start:3900 stop:5825 length:1926 start_codon:yes stop_codon:yes gene_type:complete
MQFKHPELLYALFLLLIPIIVHLFQLRRFQKVDFTNVAFLKKVTIQTRKSSELKKWLTLLARLAAMAFLIFAFTQPFTASKTALNTNKETVLYIDNSFSMQAKGDQGPLLQRAIQDLFDSTTGTEKVSWFNNDTAYKNSSPQDFKNDILKIAYSQKQLSPAQVVLKANQLFSKDIDASKRLIMLSDFQQTKAFPEVPNGLTIDVVKLLPTSISNFAIDTVYIATKNSNTIQLKVKVSSYGKSNQSTPISLYNGNSLIAKTEVDFTENQENTVTFDIENNGGFKGRLELTDPNLSFDNALFFSINPAQKLKVLSINEKNADFLRRLFDQPEFDYSQQSFQNLDYSEIPSQNFVILNELKEVPPSLLTALKSFSDNGGSLLIIPSLDASVSSYNNLLTVFQLGNFSEFNKQEKQITQIVFDHPLYRDVFEKRVVNFQYPKVNSYFNIASSATSTLKFEDGMPFLIQKSNIYLFSAPINSENSNFQNSPLIVPTLYNMAQQSIKLSKLYYTIGKQNNYSVPVALIQDEILTLRDSLLSFIPIQQVKANQVNIRTNDDPSLAGTFNIEKDKEFIELVSYNYSRNESLLQYANPRNWQGVEVFNSVNDLFNSIAEENAVHSFWKLFAMLAFLFLIFEMLLLKFYKS